MQLISRVDQAERYAAAAAPLRKHLQVIPGCPHTMTQVRQFEMHV
jgi:hypothetical protein